MASQGKTRPILPRPPMQLHHDIPNPNTRSISAYGPDWVMVAGRKITRSLVIRPDGEMLDWQCQRFEDLTHLHFEQLAHPQTELVIFGSGQKMRFAPCHLTRLLTDRQIGIECMDTHAACRTYNILAAEGRQVVAALLI